MNIISCPHCGGSVIIEQRNCGIFRHAILKISGEQINPHAPKNECDKYIQNGEIYGCGMPFKIKNDEMDVEICEYI